MTTENIQSVRALSRKNRVYVFRDFLCATYGDWLRKEDVILDGAGGKGDLSWLLTNVDGFDSIIADPRLGKSNHILRSVSYLRQHPDVVQERVVPGLPTFQPLAVLLPRIPELSQVKRPRHLRVLVDDQLVQAVRHYQDTQSLGHWKVFWLQAIKKGLEANTLGYEEKEEQADNLHHPATNMGPILDAEEALHDVILKLRLIIGFHPDQATEALMDLAKVLRVPFAVVPCCVFPSEFPHRLNQDELSRVRTYAEFLDYLKVKFPLAREASLDFVFTDTAKSRVLFTLPSDV